MNAAFMPLRFLEVPQSLPSLVDSLRHRFDFALPRLAFLWRDGKCWRLVQLHPAFNARAASRQCQWIAAGLGRQESAPVHFSLLVLIAARTGRNAIAEM